ncbi:conserved membrane hypothetical protein [uncultured Pleomorphomonas sp.]|uniref:DUF1468 domain-containing protein n=1 Tax=uncultured Pleomorphomonas sp. TaxID=442121 RepID=A0A212LGK5_9HYPH|nr:tripartite tricarboxylate transporter TctB family protein [uncultured Pleomorphomonas sp.]SCM76519.1 conserved membrane hypothetical protein [uncultured Pleomorphomonas sp.]
MRQSNAIVAILSVLLGAVILWLASDLTHFDEAGVPGEAFWPSAIAWLFIALGLVQAAEVAFAPSLHAGRTVDLHSTPVRIAFLGAAIALAFAVLLTYFGFIVATAVFVPALMLLMGARSPVQITLTTAGVIAVVWVFFVLIFNNELPPPSLFE